MKTYTCLAAAVITLASCRHANAPAEALPVNTHAATNDFVFQYSIIDALLAGVFDGDLPVGALKERGDFGIGTFNGLDGEMIVMDGKVMKMRSNGEIAEVPDTVRTPLAFVKFFRPDTALTIPGPGITYERLKTLLSPYLNENKMYALRLKGNFRKVEARSVAPAPKPYPQLAAYLAAGGQTSFSFSDTRGTCIGFISPVYTARTNVPGYHLHYIDEAMHKGGHVFDFEADTISVEIDRVQGFTIELNTHKDYDKADLNKNRKEELKTVEQKSE